MAKKKSKEQEPATASSLKARVLDKDPHIIDLSTDFLTADHGKISTGIVELDEQLNGGLPKGKLTEIFGWEASGKSAIIDGVVTEIIRQDGYVQVIETERAHEKNRLREKLLKLPNTIDKMPNGKELTIQEWEFLKEEERMTREEYAERGEEFPEDQILFDPIDEVVWSGADVIEHIIEEHLITLKEIKAMGKIDFPTAIIVDSIAACGSIKEEEAEVGEQQYSPHAMVISKNLRNKIISLAAETKTALIWVNQLRDKMSTGGKFAGLKGAKQTSDDYQTFGGKSIRFYASLRLNVADVGKYTLEHGEGKKKTREPVGQWSEVHIIKSKVWGVRPWQKCRYIIGYDGGTDCAWGVFEHLKNNDMIKAAGIHGSKVEGLEGVYFKKNDFQEFFVANKAALEELIYENTEDESVEEDSAED